MSTSLLRTVVFVLFKETYFYVDWLPVTSRCASRGKVRYFCPGQYQSPEKQWILTDFNRHEAASEDLFQKGDER